MSSMARYASNCFQRLDVTDEERRNGGAAAPATLDARYT